MDPAVTSGDRSDETGIIVAGRTSDGHVYVVADYSGRYTPERWAQRAADAYEEHVADAVIVETNQGGDLVVNVLRSNRPALRVKRVHASRGKRIRAEPISALWEQGRGHIVGSLPDLEDQLVTWSPLSPSSPDRLDAMVWALTDLAAASGSEQYLRGLARMCQACDWPNLPRYVTCQKCREPLM